MPCGPTSPVLGVLNDAGLLISLGERSKVSFFLVLWRYLPHTYSCTCFYSTKQRWKQAWTLPVVNTGESKLLLNEYLKKPKFLLFCFFLVIFYIFILLLLFFFMAS